MVVYRFGYPQRGKIPFVVSMFLIIAIIGVDQLASMFWGTRDELLLRRMDFVEINREGVVFLTFAKTVLYVLAFILFVRELQVNWAAPSWREDHPPEEHP